MDVKEEIRVIQDKLREQELVQDQLLSIKEILHLKHEKRKILSKALREKKVFITELEEKSGLQKLIWNLKKKTKTSLEEAQKEIIALEDSITKLNQQIVEQESKRSILEEKDNSFGNLQYNLKPLFEKRSKELLNGSVSEKIKFQTLQKEKSNQIIRLKKIEDAIDQAHCLTKVNRELVEILDEITKWRRKEENYLPVLNKKKREWTEIAEDKSKEVELAIDKFKLALLDISEKEPFNLQQKLNVFKGFVDTLEKLMVIDWEVKKKIDAAFQSLTYIENKTNILEKELLISKEVTEKKYKDNNDLIWKLMGGWKV